MTPAPDPVLTRRAFLAMIAAAGAVACTPANNTLARPSEQPTTRTARPEPSDSAEPTPTPSAPSRPAKYEPIDGETYPNAKRLAGRFVQALTTYDHRAKPKQILRNAATRTDSEFDFASVLKRAAPLFVADAMSQGTVVYPQLGGLTLGPGIDRTSVMVVVRQDLLYRRPFRGRLAHRVTRTVDIRLASRDDEWLIEDLADAGGSAVHRAPDSLPDVAREVLDDSRIELPDSARWDILRGDIDERLLTTMLDLAGVAPYSVAVLKSGHPRNVFGTDQVSGHTLGRGVDIWKIAGKPVVLQQPSEKSDAHAFTAAALNDFGVPELGSPWDLDGPPQPGESRPSFTDPVHADHIHVAFKAA